MKKSFWLLVVMVLTLALGLAAQNLAQGEEKFVMPKNPVMVMETNEGTIEIKLFPDIAPKACENFIRLAEKGYYNGLIFHRVIENFMVQGGDPTGTGRGGESIWGEPFADEVTSKVSFDKVGRLAMANSGPTTNGSQFFITVAKTPWLNMKHTIFGEVSKGYDVIEKISQCAVDSQDKPLREKKIVKLYLEQDNKAGK